MLLALELINKLKNAKLEASPKCIDGGEHEFVAFWHGDSADHFYWAVECKKCSEVVKKSFKRDERW